MVEHSVTLWRAYQAGASSKRSGAVRRNWLQYCLPGSQRLPAFIEGDVPTARLEYAVLVTVVKHEILKLAQMYRGRADAEDNFDESKNQWVGGGCITQDLGAADSGRAWWLSCQRLVDPIRKVPPRNHRTWFLRPIVTRAFAKFMLATADPPVPLNPVLLS